MPMQLTLVEVAGADLDGLVLAEDVQFGQGYGVDAVDQARVVGNHAVEPTDPAGAAGGGAELRPELAQPIALNPQHLSRHGPVANPRGVGLEDADRHVDLPWRDAR